MAIESGLPSAVRSLVKHLAFGLSRMAPEVGIEPTTHGLTVRRSTADLLWNKMVAEDGFAPSISWL